MHQSTYSMFTFFSMSESKRLTPRRNVHSPSFLTAQMIRVHIICIPTWIKRSKLLMVGPAICYCYTIFNILRTARFRKKFEFACKGLKGSISDQGGPCWPSDRELETNGDRTESTELLITLKVQNCWSQKGGAKGCAKPSHCGTVGLVLLLY